MANMKEIITKAGTTAAFALAMTAALAIPANASENGETPITDPIVENPPVQEEATPVETPVTEQEVVQHNETVEQKNEQTVQENAETVEKNESTASENASIVETNEETVESNETTAGENETIVQENETILNEKNKETVEDNQQIAGENEELIQDKELENELPDAPQLPETEVEDNIENPDASQLPDSGDIPGAPDTSELPEGSDLDAEDSEGYNENVDEANKEIGDINKETENANEQIGNANESIGDYNEQVGNTNEGIGNYNEQVGNANGNIGSYNEQAGIYNEAVGKINKELEDQYQKEHDQWVADKTAHDTAVEEFKAKETAYYASLAQWEIDHAAWEQKLAEHRETYGHTNEEEYNALLAAYEKAHGEWVTECETLKNAYETAKAKYDQLVTENEIYDDVLDYNADITQDNADIDSANTALEEAADADTVATLEEAAESNAAVNEELAKTEAGQKLLETLGEKNREALAAEEARLAAEAAELDKLAAENFQLGSEAYANYLARVEKFNEDVKTHNENVVAYNEAVTKYNEKVADYNENQEPITDTVGGYEEGNADWGNVDIDGHTPGHLDVKYAAAVTAEKEEDSDDYTLVSSKYTVVGVYTDSSKAGTADYGLNYLDKTSGEFESQDLKKETHEFRIDEGGEGNQDPGQGNQQQNKGIKIDSKTGMVSFYVTLQDGSEVVGLNVNLNASSTYAEGTYFRPTDGDKLQYFRDSEDNALKTVTIDGQTYYDISGQSVFVISALACNGAGVNDEWKNGEFVYTINPDGLDLVLNVETLIKIHQEGSAQKITYQGYLLGKTAYAEEPEQPGEEPNLELPPEPEKPEYNPFTDEEPKKPNPPENAPGDFTDPEPTLVKLNELEELKELGTLTELETITELGDFETLKELEHKLIYTVPEEIPEEEPVWFNDDIPVVDLIDLEEENGPFVQILDEDVPLADVPKTGDVSLLFGMSSLISLSGLYLTGKKRNRRG